MDLRDGSGLDAALADCDAVVDASNAGPRAAPARAVLVEGNRRLLAAGARAGVGHYVCLSIVGIDRFPLAYYRAGALIDPSPGRLGAIAFEDAVGAPRDHG